MTALSFLSDLIQSIGQRGRDVLRAGSGEDAPPAAGLDLQALSFALLSHRGEASGVAMARQILDGYHHASAAKRRDFLVSLATRFGSDEEAVIEAMRRYEAAPSRASAAKLHNAAEPRSQEVIRRLNLATGGTAALVRMREDLLALMGQTELDPILARDLKSLDDDFRHLFSSWFNRGFLVLKRIDWTSPAHVLEKIVRYEAVHAIRDWQDLRNRVEPADRRCYAFFHPQLVDEPLIFVEVALTVQTPDAIAPILDEKRVVLEPSRANTATFYSISNCQAGLAGVSFGNFLIKQVVEDLQRDLPALTTFVTLSPVPGFAAWLFHERQKEPVLLPAPLLESLSGLEAADLTQKDAQTRYEAPLRQAAACYFLEARGTQGRVIDPVARFHLGNGARLERINLFGDVSRKGLTQSHGVMVNYLYDLAMIEKNHEDFVADGVVATASALRKLLPERKSTPEAASVTQSA